jgi:hypothetical protein
MAVESWPTIDGYAAAHGMPDLRKLPLDRFLNFVWFMATRNSSATDVEKLRARLWRPPKGEAVTDSRSPWSPEKERGAFQSLKVGLGLGGPNSGGKQAPSR